MNICLFTPSFLPKVGGMEVVLDKLARQFTAAGHRVTVLAKRPREADVANSPSPRGGSRGEGSGAGNGNEGPPYRVVYYPRSPSQVWFLGPAKRALLAQHAREGFDVINAHQAYPTGYVAAGLKKRLGVPVVITSHRGDIGTASPLRQRWITRRRMIAAMRQADAVTGVSAELKQIIDQLTAGRAKSFVIPNGVDLDVELPGSPPRELVSLNGKPFVLTLGRLHPYKGLDVLLDAMGILHRGGASLVSRAVLGPGSSTGGQAASGIQTASGTQAASGPRVASGTRIPHLVIAGDGPIRAGLERRTKDLGLADTVTFVGPVFGQAKNWLLANCEFFLQPSREEGMPLTVLEAMAAGKAVIGSDLPGIRELVTPGESGLLVPVGSAQGLADAIARLSADQSEQIRLGHGARLAARGYGWPAIAERYLQLFQSLVS